MPVLIILIIVLLVIFGKKLSGMMNGHSVKYGAAQLGEYTLKDKGEDIIRNAPRPDPERGFTNFPRFSVVGKRKTTNRKNTLVFCVKDEDTARARALNDGLMEPLTITRLPIELGSGVSEYDIKIPKGASYYDQKCLENSCLIKDTKHVTQGFMTYATRIGVQASWLCGRDRIAEDVFNGVDARERAALYGYAVHCAMRKQLPGDIAESKILDTYYAFADEASRDSKIYTSIINRPGSDMWAPSKKTVAYSFAEKFFSTL